MDVAQSECLIMPDTLSTPASPASVPPMLNDEREGAPRLNRRQTAKLRTRQKVLEAARGLFAERGYDAATIRDIARAAGMSTGAVFANFQDKAELFETVFAEETALSLAALKAGARGDTARERLVGALGAGYRRSLEHLPLTQAMIARTWLQPADADARTRAHVRPLIEALVAILDGAKGAGGLRADIDAPFTARMIWEAYVSNFRFAAYERWGADALADHMGRQVDLILASQMTRN